MKTRFLLACGAVLVLMGTGVRAGEPAFRDPDLPVDRRVENLLGSLSVEEKEKMLEMKSAAVPRLGIPAYHWWSEGLHGIARNGTATVFPQAIGLAATWDPALQKQIGDVIATEARAKNNAAIAAGDGSTAMYQGLTIWSPNVNIFRDPRWGRGQETYGEDPFLTGRMAVAFVEGLQGDDPHYLKTVATLKHFCVHSGPESLRHKFDAKIPERDLHETYLPAFEAGVREGHAMSLMSAYNAVDGVPMPANKALLTDLLRGQWGFSGAVVGDVDTVADIWKPDSHHYVGDAAQASAAALKAGNDLCSGTTYDALPDALKRGLIDESDLDRALGRLLTLRFKLGQFDPPERVPYRAIGPDEIDSPAHARIALQAARESLVLLKNDGTLPWNPRTLKTVAVLGPGADDPSVVVGNYSGYPSPLVTMLGALRSKLASRGVPVVYESAVPMLPGPRGRGHDLPSGVLFTDDTQAHAGLRGELFNNADFKGNPVAVRRDAQVDFRWDAAHPARRIPAKGAHLRWTGLLVPKVDGSYTLSLTFAGAAQVFLDDKPLISEARPGDSGEVRLRSAVLDLDANHRYHLRIEYHPRDTIGLLQFGWLAPDDLDRALAAAKKADHIVLALGISPALEGEEMHFSADGFAGGDRTSILLPAVQRDLLKRVAALGKPFTVVLTNGSALSFDVSKPNAILESWYYGQGGGEAIAEALLGETNPSGHLPVTFYKSDDDLPDFTDYRMAHRTYRYFDGTPLFPFGHGLSYTTFRYEKVDSSVADGQVTLTVKVRNTGKRAGDAVVQVYASALQPPVSMPREWLVGFARQPLEAGEDENVSVVVPLDHLRRWDDESHRFVIDSGSYQFRIGSSSADTPLTTDFQIQ